MKNEALVIREFEEILSGHREFNKTVDNWTMFKAYQQGKESGNARLDFNDVILDEDIQPIAETVRRLDIKEFTISCATFSIIRHLAAFAELGIKVQGIVKVNSRFHVSYDNSKEHEVIPAFFMKVE